jgi:hypothetical protein
MGPPRDAQGRAGSSRARTGCSVAQPTGLRCQRWWAPCPRRRRRPAPPLAAVGGAADPKGAEALRKALQDPDSQVREAASSALLNQAAPAEEARPRKPE